jgi:metal-responsive CopG/Arc/MetJ family transcriptional regulator
MTEFDMPTAVKKTISLPPELAEEIEKIASEEGKTLSAVIQDAIRIARQERLKSEFKQLQDYWSKKAREKGILTEKELESFLNN